MENPVHEPTHEDAWVQIVPLLNETINQLRETDRNALLLRFFKGKSFRAVGAGLGMSEDAAKKRVMRALEKLRTLLGRRGVVLPAAILAATLSVNAVQAAPLGLSASVAAVAAAKGVTATTSTLTLTKGIIKFMAWTKMKTAVVIGAVILLAAGTTTTMVVYHQHRPLPEPQPVSPLVTDFPKGSWYFAGFANPQSALVSGLWAQSKTDSKTFLSCLSPEAHQKQQQEFKARMKNTGKSEAQVYAESARRMDKTLGFRILGQEVVSENQVLLHLYIQGNEIKIDAKMVKVGNEWRLDDFINEKRLAPNEQP